MDLVCFKSIDSTSNPKLLAKALDASIEPSLFLPNLKFEPAYILETLKFLISISDKNSFGLQFCKSSLKLITIKYSTPIWLSKFCFSSISKSLNGLFFLLKKSLG